MGWTVSSSSSYIEVLTSQCFPTFLVPGTDFVEDNFSMDRGWEYGFGMIQVHYTYCALYFCYYHLKSSGIRSWMLGTPSLALQNVTVFGDRISILRRWIWQNKVTMVGPRRRRWHPTPVLLPGKSHGWRGLVGCSPWDCWGSDTTERLPFHFSLFMNWRRKWQPTPVFLPGESQGQGSLVGCCLWGCTELDTTGWT